jgi:hypothetical protein
MALPRLNVKQVIIFLLGGTYISFIFYWSICDVSFFGVGFSLLFAYCMACLIYLTADPIDEEILQTPQTIGSLSKSICPFCNTNPISPYTLKVGYRKGLHNFKYCGFWFEWSRSYREIYSRIPICEHCHAKYLNSCSRKFLPKAMRNPSKIVLQKKLGYRRGLKYPFETWLVKSSLDE